MEEACEKEKRKTDTELEIQNSNEIKEKETEKEDITLKKPSSIEESKTDYEDKKLSLLSKELADIMADIYAIRGKVSYSSTYPETYINL